MNRTAHTIYVSVLVGIVVAVTAGLIIYGSSYYQTDLTERFYHTGHKAWKASGSIGHGLGIIGTLMIIFGVGMYMLRKRNRFFARFGILKHWLEFHIFLCTLGPILVLFHTTFKFGGIVSISFWSMVAVVASGVIGRFIYLQIPRTIKGRQMTLSEVQAMKTDVSTVLKETYRMDEESYSRIMDAAFSGNPADGAGFLKKLFKRFIHERRALRRVRQISSEVGLKKHEIRNISRVIKNEMDLNVKIGRLQAMQRLFRYWHVAHLPFAMIMLIIMVVHVGVTLALGYKWIF